MVAPILAGNVFPGADAAAAIGAAEVGAGDTATGGAGAAVAGALAATGLPEGGGGDPVGAAGGELADGSTALCVGGGAVVGTDGFANGFSLIAGAV